eukprot:4532603-Amphidinium_carterae.1
MHLGQPTQVNSINATLVLDEQYKDTNGVRQWAVLIDTGATTSMTPRHHFNHLPLQKRAKDPQNLTSVNGESIQIYGIRHVTIVHNNLAIPTTFIIADNKLTLEIQGYSGYLSNGRVSVKLHYIGNQFYIKATRVDGFYKHVDYTEEFASWYNKWYNYSKQENMVYGIGSDDDPN